MVVVIGKAEHVLLSEHNIFPEVLKNKELFCAIINIIIVVHLVSLCILVVHTSLLVVLFMFLVHLVVLLGLFFKFYYRLLQSTTAVVTWL